MMTSKMKNIKKQNPYYNVEVIDSVSAIVHTKRIGSLIVEMEKDEQGEWMKHISWLPQTLDMKLHVLSDTHSQTLEDSVQDVIDLLDKGWIYYEVYGILKHAVHNWNEVPEILVANYEALKAVIPQAS